MTYRLILGNCIEGMRELEDKSADHAIMDPPFEAEAHSRGRRVSDSALRKEDDDWRIKGATVQVKQISYPPISEAERTESAREVARLTKRWILIFCQSEAAHKWRACLEDAGAQYIRTGVYWKADAQPQYSGDRPGVGWEAIVIAHGMPRTGRTRWNGGGKCARWDASADARFGKKLAVDGQKPERLMVQLVEDFTEVGDLVLDPFAGAGTTGVACLKTGRRFIGFERLPAHHAIAMERLQTATAQERLAFTPMKQLTLSRDTDLP